MKFSDFSGFTWLHFGITLVSLDYTLVSLWYHFGITGITLVSLWYHWYHFGITLVSLWYHFGITLVSLWYHLVMPKIIMKKLRLKKNIYTFRKCPTTLRVLPKVRRSDSCSNTIRRCVYARFKSNTHLSRTLSTKWRVNHLSRTFDLSVNLLYR